MTNQQIQENVARRCTVQEDGLGRPILVRGYVQRVVCQRCGHPRWDDGTRCRQFITLYDMECGAYYNGEHSRNGDEEGAF